MSDEVIHSVGLEGFFAKQRAFLVAFGETGQVTQAAKIAGVSRPVVYVWLKDKAFAQAFADYEQIAARNLEDEAYRRAHDGVRRPVLYKGEQVMVLNPETGAKEPLWEYEFSDTLMNTLLRGLKPERYREKPETVVPVVAQPGNVTINLQQTIIEALERYPEARYEVAKKLLEISREPDEPNAESDAEIGDSGHVNGHAATSNPTEPDDEGGSS